MKVFPMLLFMAVAMACNLSFRLNIEKIISDAKNIRDGEKSYWVTNRRYADLQELVIAGLLGNEVADGRDSGFFLELKADEDQYTLMIYPDYSEGVVKAEDNDQLSIFCNETGVIRFSLNPKKRADERSEVLRPKN